MSQVWSRFEDKIIYLFI